jgi:hypothetical protein
MSTKGDNVLEVNYDSATERYLLCQAYEQRYGEVPPAMLFELESRKHIRSSQVAELALVTARAVSDHQKIVNALRDTMVL